MNLIIKQAIKQNVISRVKDIYHLKQAIIKDEKVFEQYYEKLQTVLTRAWNEGMRKAATAALNQLRDMDKASFTQADGELVMREMAKHIGTKAFQQATQKDLFNLTDMLYRTGHIETAQAVGVDINFNRKDTQAIKILKEHNLYWVGNSWDNYTKEKIDKALTQYFTEGMTTRQLAEALGEEFYNWTTDDKPNAYLTVLADHLAMKTRELGRIPVYERAKVKFLVVRARMDERTTAICRALNGKRIPLDSLTKQRDKFFELTKNKDMEGVKKIWKMYSDTKDAAEIAELDAIKALGILPSRIGSPPYHFRCRTVTVVYFV